MQTLKWEILRSSDSLVMDDEMLRQGNQSYDEAGLCSTFWSMHTMHKRTPPPLIGNRRDTLCRDAMAAAPCVERTAQTAWEPSI